MPRRHAPVGGGAERGLEPPCGRPRFGQPRLGQPRLGQPRLGQPRLGQRGADGGDPHVGDGPVLEAAERVDPDPGDVDVGHRGSCGAKA